MVMVFKSVSWQAFLVAAGLLSSLWYGVVLPLLYRRQLRDWLDRSGKKNAVEPFRRDWEEELEDEALTAEEELLGKSKLPEGMSRVSMDMFGFAPEVELEDSVFRERQQSLVPDVIEELKSIFHILEKEQGTKEDFFSLFALVKAKYAGIRGTASEQALNDYIRDQALFPVSDDELTQLWN